MIEGGHANARIVRGGKKCITGSQAGAHDAQPAVSLLLQPIQAAANVHHRLAARVERAPDVGGHRVVGAARLRRHANVVIRHAQAQHRDAHQVQHPAQSGVSHGIGIPMRQQHHGPPPARRKPARVHQIVFRIRRVHRRGEAQEISVRAANFRFQPRVRHFPRAEDLDFATLKAKIRRRRIGIKLVARGDDALVVLAQKFLRIAFPGTCPGAKPLRHGQSRAHSTPHSSGRTTRLLSTDVRRVSQSYIHCS